jgi:hypothetical protein
MISFSEICNHFLFWLCYMCCSFHPSLFTHSIHFWSSIHVTFFSIFIYLNQLLAAESFKNLTHSACQDIPHFWLNCRFSTTFTKACHHFYPEASSLNTHTPIPCDEFLYCVPFHTYVFQSLPPSSSNYNLTYLFSDIHITTAYVFCIKRS